MSDWLIIIALAPLIAALLVSGWFAAGLFILWIASLMAAVLVAGIVFLLLERAAFHIGRFISWLKVYRR